VLVRGNRIERISSASLALDPTAAGVVIAGGGRTLMRGFTTVRDVGGPAFGLKRAIDEDVLPGPRIYPSGAMITVTSGHGDFRQSFLPTRLSQPV